MASKNIKINFFPRENDLCQSQIIIIPVFLAQVVFWFDPMNRHVMLFDYLLPLRVLFAPVEQFYVDLTVTSGIEMALQHILYTKEMRKLLCIINNRGNLKLKKQMQFQMFI